MKVRQALEWLKDLDPDEEIVMAHWSKEWVNEVLTGMDELPVTTEEWNEVVRNLQHEAIYFEDMADALEAAARELTEERDN